MFKPSPHHLLFKPSDYAVWPITFALSFLHHLLHTQCYCPYAMLYVTKKKDMKKARNQSRSLIFHVRMRIIQNNAGNPNERDEHSKNLKPSPKPSGYLEYSEGCFGIIRIPVSPPRITQPNQTTHSLCGSAVMTWNWTSTVAVSIFVLICHFSSFMNIWAGQEEVMKFSCHLRIGLFECLRKCDDYWLSK